ncbi:RluA family pseudouridine synthase [Rhodospirillum rubrum]|uniref:Pseudouridine synthase n=1 Tax=Rhodospirillum rubrum (strain ATCC 11170 / ATH 1.1.1 / DSM 467 / LMG 4362 / NCIMB 8255 / S1) TaxID=269796 RepID=Q2RQY9_RHORT|nr:RluA family pseudouridine synthase [Rhodospirillum rubrum]ABC23456.1 ribosomal large subunit pseudouridine synthase C [Rhodospirillum rubrum ATCC 11170]AEO49194.1 ribosomal large subunit pseudouridine synthase C [Rhodospirillum rubrum F11]MBK5955126.1 pseudouridine synthase [Rhodospirillum rubrum]QXG79427.1 RluA family pseudouridine synthase [Rhodospirillum rubrum]
MSVETVAVTQDEDGSRLDRWFKRRYPALTHGRLEKLLRTGQIRVDGKRVKSGERLEAGQQVRVPPLGDEAPSPSSSGHAVPRPAAEGEIRALRRAILHEDAHLIVINKEAGLAVQGGTGTPHHLDGMLESLADGGETPRLVHRLDKDTSGVLVLARTQAAARALTSAFRSREALKVYWAIVVGRPPMLQGTIKGALAKVAGGRGERMEINEEEGKRAVTDFRVVDQAAKACAWVELHPRTGRTHQLRVHCLEMGTPILGDGKYGGPGAFLEGTELPKRMHLHARALALPHPAGGVLEIIAPPPPHFVESLKTLGFALSDAPNPFEGWDVD